MNTPQVFTGVRRQACTLYLCACSASIPFPLLRWMTLHGHDRPGCCAALSGPFPSCQSRSTRRTQRNCGRHLHATRTPPCVLDQDKCVELGGHLLAPQAVRCPWCLAPRHHRPHRRRSAPCTAVSPQSTIGRHLECAHCPRSTPGACVRRHRWSLSLPGRLCLPGAPLMCPRAAHQWPRGHVIPCRHRRQQQQHLHSHRAHVRMRNRAS